jgi:hypothetical protein
MTKMIAIISTFYNFVNTKSSRGRTVGWQSEALCIFYAGVNSRFYDDANGWPNLNSVTKLLSICPTKQPSRKAEAVKGYFWPSYSHPLTVREELN